MPSWRRVSRGFQSDMDTDNKGVLSRFAKVKRDLDPAFGYVVFEEPLGLPNSVLLKGVPGFLSKVEKGVLEQTLYRDETGGKLYLVAKLDPDEADDISQKFLNIPMPKETIFYVYGRRSNPT